MIFCIAPDATVRCLQTEAIPLKSLGRVEYQRASHVEPTDDGRWTADLSPVGGPVLGPFDERSDALAAEVDWIETHVLSCD